MMSEETQSTDAANINYPDISDCDGQFAVIVEGRIERRFYRLAEAEEYTAELDEYHIQGEIIDTS